MAEHKPGSMDITEQERTFEGFIKITIRAVIVIFAILIFLALVNA
ncbi:MAG: aa3-type cytochrome c oxidase subunit IV [Rubellimicrobium sp.]|nr:aa3-type cytochrome c oxidase subunit IV [Rubellimicrobium sp.]